MTNSNLTGSTGLCRCAVCKIDLRGRFVFIDSQTEELVGCASEELFGKSILDFLDDESGKIIEQVLADRNHYETHYDYTALTLLGKDSATTVVDATISLSFIGGNPVNYQLILRPQSQTSRLPSSAQTGPSAEEFIRKCVEVEPSNRLESLAALLQTHTSAEQVAIYLIGDSNLEPISCATRITSNGSGFDAITEPSELHLRVVKTGEAYAFNDAGAMQAVREAGVEPPPEFVMVAKLENQPCLLRFVFSDDMPDKTQSQVVDRARLAGQLAVQLFNAASVSDQDSEPGIDIQFSIGLLSALGVGALLTDSDGNIVGYNPVLVEILDELSPGETSRDFIKLLEGENNAGWAALIHEQLQDGDTADLRIDFTLPSGAPYLLAIIKFADEAGDQTACWALMPRFDSTGDNSVASSETTVWSSLMDGMRPALDELANGAEALSRDYCRQVKQLDSHALDRLHNAVRTIHQMMTDSSLLHTIADGSASVDVSLCDLVDAAAEAVRDEFPDVTITCEHDALPSIRTSPARLAAVLRNLMANCVRHNQNPEVTIVVSADISQGRCRMVVSDDGSGMPRRQFRRLFDFYLPPTATGIQRRNGGAGLGLSRLLVQDLGGTIRGASKEGVGTRLAVMLPQSPGDAE